MKNQTKTNEKLVSLIKELKTHSASQKSNFWKKIAIELEKPTRKSISVNLSHINKHIKDKEIALIPGKVLGTGDYEKTNEVAALQFSDSAKIKIKNKLTIHELFKKNPTGKGVRILKWLPQ